MSDGAQSLSLQQFEKMMNELQPYIALWKQARVHEAVVA
jgi:3-deoxy-D-arabino-heptulosonate 7-phosphate (DAHP) synthase